MLVLKEKTHIKSDILINSGVGAEHFAMGGGGGGGIDWQAEFACFPRNVLKSNRNLQNI